ncbi:lytic murein transglycosylase [Micromonospora sp. NPDC002296]|uniref:lytic transglycosylase domain-containing protein n=1 Tax=Micromonospora sp. NPDC002296 TaxID=3154271 RepID=UPI00332D327E
MGDTRRVVDGEDKSTVRPLRPAAPPEDPGGRPAGGWLPRPRRPWLRSTEPTDAAPQPAALRPADVSGPAVAGQTDAGQTDAAAVTGPTDAAAATGPKAGATATAASTAGQSDPTHPAEKPEPGPSATVATTAATADAADPTGRTAGAAVETDGPSKVDAAGKADADGKAAGTDKADADQKDAGTDKAGGSEKAGKGEKAEKADATVVAGDGPARRSRRRVPFAHAVRMPPPRQVALAAARTTRAWSRRPSGRLTLPGLFLLALVGATAAAGALLVPATAPESRPVAVDATATNLGGGTAAPPGGVVPGVTGTELPPGATALPGATPGLGGLPGGPVMTGRPADALAGWAQQTGAKAGISPVAVQAYGYAELVLAQSNPGCRLSWTTLAAIGYVESRHGQANGASLGTDGRALPEIIGDPLDGNGGRSKILDTDRGLYDRDTVYDRAIGPMQFIPTTWQEIGADADNDGRKDPHDLDDAALAAGNYLCKGGRNLTVPGDWWGSILSYNDVRRYAQDVFDKANEYGLASRT